MSQERKKVIVCEFDPAFYITHRKSCLWDLVRLLCELREDLCEKYVEEARGVGEDAIEIEGLIHEVAQQLGIMVIVKPRGR